MFASQSSIQQRQGLHATDYLPVSGVVLSWRRIRMTSFSTIALTTALLLCCSSLTVRANQVASTNGPDPVWEIRHLLPEANLENNTVTNVTVQVGATAFLPCLFRHLADHQVSDPQVSWFRRRDWHILTTGVFTYTTDERFTVLHPEDSDDWTLQIKYTTSRDNGTYECQLSTGTGVISQFVNLEVVVPQAVILGSEDYHVQLGSTIRLVCIIEQSPTPPQYVFWYHNDGMINYDTRRGGINVSTETGSKTQSFLTIRDAHYDDTGNYTCSASNTQSDSTSVYVSHGDKMAAIQRRKSSSPAAAEASLFTLLCSWVLLLSLQMKPIQSFHSWRVDHAQRVVR